MPLTASTSNVVGAVLQADFFIVEDHTEHPAIGPVLDYFNRNHQSCELIDLASCPPADLLSQMKSSNPDATLVSIGEGGGQMLGLYDRGWSQFDVLRVQHSRVWHPDGLYTFEHNLDAFEWSSRKVMIVEDVIGSGETLTHVIRHIEEHGGNIVQVCTGVLMEGSRWVNEPARPIFSGVMAISSSRWRQLTTSDPHWFPPVYSSRHLFYGDKENPLHFENLAAKYFAGDSELCDLIKTLRDSTPAVHATEAKAA